MESLSWILSPFPLYNQPPKSASVVTLPFVSFASLSAQNRRRETNVKRSPKPAKTLASPPPPSTTSTATTSDRITSVPQKKVCISHHFFPSTLRKLRFTFESTEIEYRRKLIIAIYGFEVFLFVFVCIGLGSCWIRNRRNGSCYIN